MNMLPRLKPRCFYDLVIEVAIVRPGPIQGDMVHPYLKRRAGQGAGDLSLPRPEHGPPDELESILGRTLGVPIFQEQAMKIALDAAKFTSEEANQLRKAMATFRSRGNIELLQDKMVGRMVARGYDPDFAQRCFDQIKGFGEYGFPESHAASFAHLVYVSSWLKWQYPAAFAGGAAQLAADGLLRAGADRPRCARAWRRGARGRCELFSDWDCTLEAGPQAGGAPCASACARSTACGARGRRGSLRATGAPYPMCTRNWRRSAGLRARHASSGSPRPTRSARWASTGARRCGTSQGARRRGRCRCSLTAERATKRRASRGAAARRCRCREHVVNDYQTMRLSLKAHPDELPARAFHGCGVCSPATDCAIMKDGAWSIVPAWC